MRRKRVVIPLSTNELEQAFSRREEEIVGRRATFQEETAALPDSVEAAEVSGRRELTAVLVDMNGEDKRLIDEARVRMADGTYGICLECTESIAPKRLNAIPWAKYCITCQDLVGKEVSQPEKVA